MKILERLTYEAIRIEHCSTYPTGATTTAVDSTTTAVDSTTMQFL